MRTITLEELLEAGCHFGHQVTRQNPKARDFIFEARDNIHIIDLEKTKEGLEEAANFIKGVAKRGGTLLVLGMTLVIVWWADVVSVFRGFLGIFLALGGLIVLYMVKE